MLQKFFIHLFYKAENLRKKVWVAMALVVAALVLVVFGSSHLVRPGVLRGGGSRSRSRGGDREG